ncbi:MAG: phenylalanine--tRNA ligase subunit beta, partial [Lentisphaerae bacterium]|nr:phenylalanine--tRNA ligase subunit beta [Lentisphaerota bacterium]
DNMLVISDGNKPVAVAGVMGGEGSEIRSETCRVLLESAGFDPANIHATSCALDLATESSHRFERGVDIWTVEWASRRAASLMADLASARVAPGVIDTCPEILITRPRIVCVFDHVRSSIGINITDKEITNILESLQIHVVERSATSCVVEAPTFRRDLEIEADLIEEVARMYGLDKVQAAEPVARIVPHVVDEKVRSVESCRAALIGLGLCETMNYSFVSHRLLDLFGTDDMGNRVTLPNPVSADHSVMRNSLIPQMLESLGRNQARQIPTAAFFEIGKVFRRKTDDRIEEDRNICIGLMGKVGRTGLNMRKPVEPEEMFLWLKGILEQLFAAVHIEGVKFKAIDYSCFEPGWSVSISLGKANGMLGLLNRALSSEWRMGEPIGIAEIPIEPLLGKVFTPIVLTPIPLYPSISRDMALIVDENVTHEQIVEIVHGAGQKHLTDIVLFDIFRAKGVGEGKKSLAYSLVYRSLEKTLTDEDANRYHEAIKDSLRNELKVEIREN